MPVEKFAPQKLYEQVFEHLKNEIKSGVYKKGDLLPSESELTRIMGVSRVTVRQALQELAETGVIETRKGKGSVVVVDWKSILEESEIRKNVEEYWQEFQWSTQARRIIEPAVARQVALTATEEDIRRLEEAIAHDERGADRKVFDFHKCLCEALHNPTMEKAMEAVVDPPYFAYKLPLIVPSHQDRGGREVKKQHEDILKAIKQHDGEYAYYYMLVHCDWIQETYSQYFTDFLEG